MNVRIRICRHIKVENHVDLFHVNSSTKYVCCNHDSMFKLFEVLISFNSLFLRQISVNGNRGEIFPSEDLVQFNGVLYVLDEDYDLVEHEWIEEVLELSDLFIIFELHVVLLQTMEGKLFLIINKYFERILHEFPTNIFDLWGESGRKHHDLLFMGGCLENWLNISPHIRLLQHFVALVQDKELKLRQIQVLLLYERQNSSWSSNYDMRWFHSFE